MPRFAKSAEPHSSCSSTDAICAIPLFHKAIVKCYEQLIAADTQPSYFVNFEVEPDTIDVNIHPQKHEIKFEHEQAIFQILEAAVRESLGKTQAAGALDFDASQSPDIPSSSPTAKPCRPTRVSTTLSIPLHRLIPAHYRRHHPRSMTPGCVLRGIAAARFQETGTNYTRSSQKRDSSISGLIV